MTSRESADPRAGAEPLETVPKLSRAQLAACLGLGVALFLFVLGPIWRRAWDFSVVNAAIFYSYLPLPLAVAACLACSRKLGLASFFLETLKVTLLKYSLTFAIALVMWSVVDPPPPIPRVRRFGHLFARRDAPPPPPEPTPLDPASTGAIRGVVVGATNEPVEGALARIASGLEAYVFAPPDAPVSLENDGARIAPALVAAQTHQPIRARSADGRLHTFVAHSASGDALFNVPLLREGTYSSVMVREPYGEARAHCTVHGAAERPATLVVSGHPFFATTGPDGAFRFEGVPAGRVVLVASDASGARAEAAADVPARGEASVRLVFGPSL